MASPAISRSRTSSPFSLTRLSLLAFGLVALGAQAGTPSLSVQPGTAKPGDPVLVTVSGLGGAPTGTINGKALRFYQAEGVWQAITGLGVEHPVGTTEVKVVGKSETEGTPVELAGTLDVMEPGYPERQLKVAGKYVKPPESVKARMAEDRAAFAAAFSQSFRAPLFQSNFAWPRQDRITAPYGDRRSFNGKLQSQHFGVDIDGDTGTPITAANDGVVVMTRENYSAGNTVIVHHGGGLYTSYFHLSKIDVKKGAKVKQGQKLGLVGKTGRVTGPHLHWGVKVDDLWVDGLTLLKLDFFAPTEPRLATTAGEPAATPVPAAVQGEGASALTSSP
ncbi:M23 family metallopeptidase [Hyalangium rubrum]|uniref:M23 family metallopeptidase n=1 Tax=Hyalangium rubrum TaxID=3103134 RepID=A0ABU5GXD7_9BACT|nr:M23 family metallopeptidase [Hyalangium sp. s54d21]MDY7225148.1 M23 family metallopeptidase [Hyalangium sp. s54d21]